jgi:hypothetical protein
MAAGKPWGGFPLSTMGFVLPKDWHRGWRLGRRDSGKGFRDTATSMAMVTSRGDMLRRFGCTGDEGAGGQ